MTTTIMPLEITAIRWAEVIEYPQTGAKSKILLEDDNCRYMLMSLTVGTYIEEHASARNATLNVIEGEGLLTLGGREFILERGVFVVIPAAARHAIKAVTNLSFLLTLSGQAIDSHL